MAKRARKILVLGVPATILGLVLAELLVRAFGLAPEIGVVRRGRYRLSDNPLIGYELLPNYRSLGSGEMVDFKGTSNSLGFRDREHVVEKPEGVYRIVVIGDSVAQGFGLERGEEMFSSVLERELLDAGDSVEVLNFAVSGYNTQQEVETLKEKGLQYDPDLVIVAYCLNDNRQSCGYIMDRLLAEESKHRVSEHVLARLKFSALARLLYFRFVKPAELTDRYAQLGEDTVDRYFGILAGLAEQHSFDVLVVIFPNIYSYKAAGRDPLHRKAAATARSKGFAVLDLAPLFAGEPTGEAMFLDIWHPGVRGHRIAGEAIARAISRSRGTPSSTVQ